LSSTYLCCNRKFARQMIGKGSIFYSVTKNKCPRCHTGDFFKTSNPYRLSTFTQMHEDCSNCKLHYELEPGFFYGSMYVSYALNVAWFVTIWVATSVLAPDLNKMIQFAIVTAVLLLLFPISFRFGRLLYTNLFVRYKKKSEAHSK
jgi:uncharacterized protein (DUF983 family)